jgi:catechol 2,3-dioxygenase-like lactoylglutathione lyase family enzyme
MDFEFAKIDHVDITAPEELQDEMSAWYRDRLGLEELPSDRNGGGRFAVGDQEVHISIDPHNPPHLAHFCLLVDNYDSVVARLREGGSHIEQARDIPGRRRFYTRDPAGNRIEIAMVTGQEA